MAAAPNNRLLVKNESAGEENGIYVVTQLGDASNPWILTRAPDADSDAEVNGGMYVFIEEGNTLADQGWVLTTNNPITLNTTPLTFTVFTGAGTATPDFDGNTRGKGEAATTTEVQTGTLDSPT